MLLGERLVRDGSIDAGQLRDALQTQVLYGGRLGTNLIEIKAVDLDTLARTLAAQNGLAAALGEHFEETDPRVVAMIPARIAARHKAIPIRLSEIAGRHLVVAFTDRPTPDTLDEIALVAGCEITPCVAPELRILYWLERHYGVARSNRYVRIEGAGARSDERRRYLQFTDSPEKQAPLPKRPPITRDTQPDIPSLLAATGTPGASSSPLPLSSAAVAARLLGAQDRDTVGDALIDHLRDRVLCAVLFLVRDAAAIGWKGFGPRAPAMDSLALPLWAQSALKLAYEGRTAFQGAPPPDGAQVHQRLWKAIGAPLPQEVLVAPVLLKDRVVNLLYLQPKAAGPMPKTLCLEVAALCTAASSAYMRLIREAKKPTKS